MDTVAWVPGSSWASDPSRQGHNRRSEVVPLVGQLGAQLEQVAPDMVLGVLAALVVSGAVALTALPARLGCTLVAAEGQPESGDEGLMEHC